MSRAATRDRPLRRLVFLLPALLFAVLIGYLLVALRPERDPTLVPSALIDKPAPAFALPPLVAGKPGLSHADLGGRPALVNFFASWCLPCRAEHPLLMRLGAGGVPLYGIAYKDDPAEARAFLAELGDPFARIGVDESGRTAIDFGLYGVPETYVIDGEARIRYRHVGPLTAAALERDILPLLEELGR